MDTYSAFREFADSWMLLFLTLFFVGVCLRAIFGPRDLARDAAHAVFRHDEPAAGPEAAPTSTERHTS